MMDPSKDISVSLTEEDSLCLLSKSTLVAPLHKLAANHAEIGHICSPSKWQISMDISNIMQGIPDLTVRIAGSMCSDCVPPI